jgi:predicted transcriptional regulator
MASSNRRAGLISISVNGERLDAKGEFTYSLGTTIREAVVGRDRIHGYKETVGVPRLEGQITDREGLDLKRLTEITDATVTLRTGTGKTVVFRNAWFAGDGSVSTDESAIDLVFQALSAEEV